MSVSLSPKIAALPFDVKLQLLERLRRMPTAAHVSFASRESLFQYREDPIGFIENELGSRLTDEQRGVCESVRDYEVTIVKSANAVGKTYDAARIAVWFYKCFEDAQVYTAAAPPESNLKRLLWGEIGAIVAEQPSLFSEDSISNLNIAKSSQSFITGVTIPTTGTEQQREAKFSGKHAANLFFIVDEGDAVPDEVYRGIDACMSGGHARLLVMFNPRAESGPVYRKERDHLGNVITLSAFNHPNVVSGEEKIAGAVTREKTVKRINEWSRPLVGKEKRDSECFDVPDFLVGVECRGDNGNSYGPLEPGVRRVIDPALSYMVLGQYPSQSETQLINKAWVADARARFDVYVATYGLIPPKATQPINGLDVAEFGSDENVSCSRYGGFVPPLVAWRGVDTLSTAERAIELAIEKGALYTAVDATGVGAGVPPVIARRGLRALRVMVASAPTLKTELGEFKILRDQLWWAVREWLRVDKGSMLPPDEKLVEELVTPTYTVDKGKIQVMPTDAIRALLKRSPDRASSLGLTFAPVVIAPGKSELIL